MEAKSVLPSPELSAADQQLVDGVLAGQRRALAKTITLIESTREDHQQRAQQVLRKLLPAAFAAAAPTTTTTTPQGA